MSQALRMQFQVGNQTFDRIWNNLEHIPDDFREPFEKMAEEFWRQNAATFAAQGAVEGNERWKELSPKYRAWKAKHYPGKPILVRSGAMKESLTDGVADGAIYEVFPKELALGSEIPYAIYHQTGSIRVMNRPPKRSPVLLTKKLRSKWTKIMTDWLRDEFAYQG